MKPQDMDQEKLLNWMKAYLERSKASLEASRESFYDAVNDGADILAEEILKNMVIKQDIYATLLTELLEAEEYQRVLLAVQKMAEGAPEA